MTPHCVSRPLTLQQSARWLPADMETPISLFKGMAGSGHGILLESAEVDGRWGRYSVLACDMALFASCRGGRMSLDIRDPRCAALADLDGMDFVPALRDLLRRLSLIPPQDMETPPITRALYGWLGFGMAGLFNPKLAQAMPAAEAEGMLALPGTVLVFDHLYNRLCQISLGEHRELRGGREDASASTAVFSPSPVRAEPDEAGYKANVEYIKGLLRQGEAIQVVPSVRFSTRYDGDPFTLYRRLRRINASPYMFHMALPGMTLFGSSPEVMVRCSAGTLQLSPIAGTRRRGHDDLEDARLAAELRADPKEQAEHVMLVDLGRNDLGRVARPGSVRVERYMDVERFSHVMHLTSSVTARLADGLDAVDVLASAFPAGTVSGAPKLRAMEIIRSVEGRGRGPYAVHWLDRSGSRKRQS